MVNANDIDSQFSDWCDAAKELMTREELSESNLPSCDVSIYDIAWVAGPFPSDTDESLFDDAEDYCDFNYGSSIDWDNTCVD